MPIRTKIGEESRRTYIVRLHVLHTRYYIDGKISKFKRMSVFDECGAACVALDDIGYTAPLVALFNAFAAGPLSLLAGPLLAVLHQCHARPVVTLLSPLKMM